MQNDHKHVIAICLTLYITLYIYRLYIGYDNIVAVAAAAVVVVVVLCCYVVLLCCCVVVLVCCCIVVLLWFCRLLVCLLACLLACLLSCVFAYFLACWRAFLLACCCIGTPKKRPNKYFQDDSSMMLSHVVPISRCLTFRHLFRALDIVDTMIGIIFLIIITNCSYHHH